MADITMCKNRKCKLRGRCLRYLAYPTIYWQAYQDYNCASEADDFYDAKDRICRTKKEADAAWRPPMPPQTS